MQRTVQKGLTIIELMIIVAIIGILASVALPAFRDYTVREKLAEAASLADEARAALGIACAKGELSGADHASLGLPPADAWSGDHARGVSAQGLDATRGVVTVTLVPVDGVIEDGRRILYTGACDSGVMRWTVSGDIPSKYWPDP